MNKKVKKTINFVVNSLIILFLIFCLISIIFAISSKLNHGTVTFNNSEIRLVETGSMERNELTDVSEYEIKDIPTNSLIGIDLITDENREEFYDSLKVGDVLTFKYYIGGQQLVITHRLIEIQEKETGGYILYLRGDNVSENGTTAKQVIDTSIDKESFNYVIGKVKWVNYPIGEVLTFMKSSVGIICIIIVPCVVLIFAEVAKIFIYISKENKEKAKLKEQEIEMLKKKLEEYEDKGGTK